ncbi:MAG TPA: MarR family transcriptional regulator [Burkholderiales bacterium]|jgi:DNA-binding MarR family transcriptional regulator|nr:MarR family transcriptional regulator [Burkholderiales bacterium]
MKSHRKRRASRKRRAASRFPDDYLPYLAARASHVILREFHALLPPRRMRVPEWRVLATLSAGGGYTVGALARATFFKQPTLSKLLDRLEKKGLVRRVAGDMDLRHSRVELTPKGRARIGPIVAQARRHEKRALKKFRARDIQALKRLLRAFTDGFERKAG